MSVSKAPVIPVQRASAASFARFGTFVAESEGNPISAGEAFSYKEKAGTMAISDAVSVGVLNIASRPPRFHEVERHLATQEMLVAFDGDVILPVAAANQPASEPDPKTLAAFRVKQGEAVIMNPGVWHGVPFALHGHATLLVVFKAGTPDHDFVAKSLGTGSEAEYAVEI